MGGSCLVFPAIKTKRPRGYPYACGSVTDAIRIRSCVMQEGWDIPASAYLCPDFDRAILARLNKDHKESARIVATEPLLLAPVLIGARTFPECAHVRSFARRAACEGR
jgi:hypothetical protein